MTNKQLNIAETITDYISSQKWLSERDMRTLAHLRNDTVCVDSPIGEYECSVETKSKWEPICVDICLRHEIHELIFKHNVSTIGSCCGHGKKQAYIQVSPQSVQKMHELGYEPLPEKADGQGKWCFKPKTYFLEPVNKTYKLPYDDLANTPISRNDGLYNILAEEDK